MPLLEQAALLILQRFMPRLHKVGDAISGDDLYMNTSPYGLPEGFTTEDVQHGMASLLMKGYFLHTIDGRWLYQNHFTITAAGLAALRASAQH